MKCYCGYDFPKSSSACHYCGIHRAVAIIECSAKWCFFILAAFFVYLDKFEKVDYISILWEICMSIYTFILCMYEELASLITLNF